MKISKKLSLVMVVIFIVQLACQTVVPVEQNVDPAPIENNQVEENAPLEEETESEEPEVPEEEIVTAAVSSPTFTDTPAETATAEPTQKPSGLRWEEAYRREGHGGWVFDVSFSASENLLATASDDRLIKIWEIESGELLATLGSKYNDEDFNAVAFSPDGHTVAFGGDFGWIYIWDFETMEELGIIKVGASIIDLAFSPDGVYLAYGSVNSSLAFYDIRTFERVGYALIRHNKMVRSVVFSPDGKFLISGGWDGKVVIWKVETQEFFALLEPDVEILSVAISGDGKYLAAGDLHGAVWIWDFKTLALEETFSNHLDAVYGLSFSPDGNYLASAGFDGFIDIYSLATMRRIQTIENIEKDHANYFGLEFSSEGNFLAVGTFDTLVVYIPGP